MRQISYRSIEKQKAFSNETHFIQIYGETEGLQAGEVVGIHRERTREVFTTEYFNETNFIQS